MSPSPPHPPAPDALYAGIADALPDAVLVTDRRNRILHENRRARSLFHAAPGDSDERRHRVELNHFLLTSHLARAPSPSDEARSLTLVDPESGDELVLDVIPGTLPPGAGPPDARLSLLRDVTELRRTSTQLGQQVRRGARAESRAREQRDQLTLILAHVRAPIVVTDDAGAVVLMNRAAERLFRPDGAAETPAAVAAANGERFFAVLEAFAEGDADGWRGRVELHDPDSGRAVPTELVSGRIRDADGGTRVVVSILHDLTQEEENARLAAELEDRVHAATAELEAQNARLQAQRRELERAYRHKSEFLASMSHELRTPINALLGYIALLRERIYGGLTERQEDALTRMSSASQHLLELVNDVLDLARIEAGRMPLHLEPVALDEVVRSLAESLEPLARRKGLSLDARVDDDVPRLVTDRTRVKQVLMNLLSNAIKFTREGGVSLAARLADEGDAVEVRVSDTGIGIAADDLASIFEDFRQVDQSSTREYGGTGLGLSIVRKLLGLLGGSVRVASTPGEGSVFTVRLPLRSDGVPPGEPAIHRAMHGQAAVVRDGRLEPVPAPEDADRGG